MVTMIKTEQERRMDNRLENLRADFAKLDELAGDWDYRVTDLQQVHNSFQEGMSSLTDFVFRCDYLGFHMTSDTSGIGVEQDIAMAWLDTATPWFNENLKMLAERFSIAL